MQRGPVLPAVGQRRTPRRRRRARAAGAAARTCSAWRGPPRGVRRTPPGRRRDPARPLPGPVGPVGSMPQSTLPFQRSPCSRAGGSSGTSSASLGIDRLDGRAPGLGHRAAVAGQLEVGQHPADGVELGPGVGGPVGHRQPPDEAVVLGAEARSAGLVGGGQRRGRSRRRRRRCSCRTRSTRSPGTPGRRRAPPARARRPRPRPASAAPPPRARRSRRARAGASSSARSCRC